MCPRVTLSTSEANLSKMLLCVNRKNQHVAVFCAYSISMDMNFEKKSSPCGHVAPGLRGLIFLMDLL